MLHFGDRHEQPPQQPGAVILDHDDDRSLIDGQEGVGIPVAALAEGIHEAVASPDLVAVAPSGNAAGGQGFVRARRAGSTSAAVGEIVPLSLAGSCAA